MPSSGVQTCALDRKSTRLNSSHGSISYAVFCLKKTTKNGVLRTVPRAAHLEGRVLTGAARRGEGRLWSHAGVGTRVRLLSCRVCCFFFLIMGHPPKPTLFPAPALFG